MCRSISVTLLTRDTRQLRAIRRETVRLREACDMALQTVIAVFLGLAFGKRWRWVTWASLIWAASIAYAQVYVGVHFPMDVIAGAMLGSGIAGLVFNVFRFERDLSGLENQK